MVPERTAWRMRRMASRSSGAARAASSAPPFWPARADADRRWLFAWISTDGVRHFGKSLPNTRSPQNGERNTSGDARLSIDVPGQNLPPVPACSLALRPPMRHHGIDLIGNVVVPVRTQPHARVVVASCGTNRRHGRRVLSLLLCHARCAAADCRFRFRSSRFRLRLPPE